MEVYFTKEKLKSVKYYHLKIRFIYEDYVIIVFTRTNIFHKRLNLIKYIIRNRDKLKFTMDVYERYGINLTGEKLEVNSDIILSLVFRCEPGRGFYTSKNFKVIEKWKQKNIMNT